MGKKLTPEQERVLQEEKQYAGVITDILDEIIANADEDNARLNKSIKEMQEYFMTLKDEREKLNNKPFLFLIVKGPWIFLSVLNSNTHRPEFSQP